MFIARHQFEGPDGAEARIIAAADPHGAWIDVRRAERLRLERAGASPAAARRIAQAAVPGSLTAALESASVFTDAASMALHALGRGEALIEAPRFVTPLDPCVYRDFMLFERHLSFG